MPGIVDTAYVEVLPDTAAFATRLKAQVTAATTAAATGISGAVSRTGAAVTAMSSKVGAAGSAMTRGLTLPLAALGVAGAHLANQFEENMAKIVGLVGVPRAQVKAWETDVRRLAGTYAKSSIEASDALFFITSAGLRGSAAMDTLESSLKASAVGLGDVATIADVATSAVNAYGQKVLPAAKAMDVLAAAVKEGKLRADELAPAMGRVLPISSALGVSFDQVGATFAALSRTGTRPDEAATQLRGILNGLLKPSAQARDQLKDLGLSAGGLRKEIREKGLLATLNHLSREFGDNEEAQARVFGNVRALSGVMNLLGANSKTTAGIFDRMKDSTGTLDRAFKETSETSGFKMRQQLGRIKGALMDVGMVAAPILADAMEMIADKVKVLRDWWKSLDPGIQRFIIQAGLVVGLAGPIASIFAKIGSTIGLLLRGLGTLLRVLAFLRIAIIQVGVAILTNPIGIIVTAIAALAIGVYLAWRRFEGFRNVVKTTLGVLVTAGQAVGSFFVGLWGVLKAVFGWVQTHWQLIAFLLAAPLYLVVAAIVTFRHQIMGAFVAVFNWIRNVWSKSGGWIAGPIGAAVTLIFRHRDQIWNAFKTVLGWFQTAWSAIVGWISGPFNTAKKAVTDAVRSMWTAVKDLFHLGSLKIREFMLGALDKILAGMQFVMRGLGKMPGALGAPFRQAAKLIEDARKKINAEMDKIKDEEMMLKLKAQIPGTKFQWKDLIGSYYESKAAGGINERHVAQISRPTFRLWAEPETGGEAYIPLAGSKRARSTDILKAVADRFGYGLLPMAEGGLTSGSRFRLGVMTPTLMPFVNYFNKRMVTTAAQLETELGNRIVPWMFQQMLGSFGGPGAGSGVQRWSGAVLRALALLNQPASLLGAVLSRMQRESGGNPSIVNRWDSNWLAGHPSVGLMQVIRGTFAAYAGRFARVGPFLYGVSTNPLANIFAGLNYALHRYPSLLFAMMKPGGYAMGTPFVPQTGLYQLHRGERVVPAAQNRPDLLTPVTVKVYLGTREITDIVRVEVDRRGAADAREADKRMRAG